MNAKTIARLAKIRALLTDCLLLLNRIDEKDFFDIVLAAQKKKKNIKNIIDNVERGNPFMMVFFLRELIDSLTDD